MIFINTLKSIFIKTPVSVILTILSFICFIIVYWYVTITAIEPYYLLGLIFLIPTIFFVLITYLTLKDKLKIVVTNIMSVLLGFLFIFIFFIAFIFLSMDAALAEVTNPDKYQRILRIINYPEAKLTEHFPSEIPDNAKNVVLYYSPGFGAESFNLKFKTDFSAIEDYIKKVSKKAIWEGSFTEALNQDFAIYSHSFKHLYSDVPPSDLKIYVIYSINGNQGELSLFAYSINTNEVVFIANDWTR